MAEPSKGQSESSTKGGGKQKIRHPAGESGATQWSKESIQERKSDREVVATILITMEAANATKNMLQSGRVKTISVVAKVTVEGLQSTTMAFDGLKRAGRG
ncbi:hypothetical protein GLOTRDRAFT_126411 [Gloeophyllum trabeum ATCC 11539]|uniref:Uncharacterized protein n=1 Tax=Gloeophyllum trabeum (strain ATCC 11539 / FP-39264 / Madison 617) TaxID=670483 RepID=S7QF29_GLOTA|nr:uncharacterized protein GLOTRDRAFT_126411 [Gloeophyllum trabeum ATCC 11539]EPQ57918.1 hypothetical protein GLOTRDRAFT_126411 [Gloeophyllum trabeum ATCC 11539]